jgi:hypothetical protein
LRRSSQLFGRGDFAGAEELAAGRADGSVAGVDEEPVADLGRAVASAPSDGAAWALVTVAGE